MSSNAINEIITKLQAMRDSKVSQPNEIEKIVQKNLNEMMKELRGLINTEIENAVQEIKSEIRNSKIGGQISTLNSPIVDNSQEEIVKPNPGIISVTVSKPNSNKTQSSNATQVIISKPNITFPPINSSKLPPPPNPVNTPQNTEKIHSGEGKSSLSAPMEQLRLEMLNQLATLKVIMHGGKSK